jgi:hypothetical protein
MKVKLFKTKILSLVTFSFISLSLFNNACSGYEEAEDLVSAKKDSLPETIDYNLHVRPILSDKCFNCHGPDNNKRQAGLALHFFDGAIKETEGRRAIVPGNLAKSEMVWRILSNDPEKMMPERSSNLSLTELEKAILIKWIKQGAKYKEHWAFIAPVNSPVPKVKTPGWTLNSIDNFILARLEKEGLKPSEKASKEKLARRVSMDLTGLPPSIAQLDSFINDSSPEAYAKLVDKLLKSPHYGERLANEWMDVARYADSHGYQDEGESEMWPWRDWVIKSFNQNLPYDKFITWQLAGDLLPNASKDQILATGFNRNHMINAEGGIIDEEFRTEYVLDRVGTTGKAFMALTVECARCHDHKYDPISQKEFYQLSAFFNQLDEPGKGHLYENSTGPTMLITDESIDEKLKNIREKIKGQENKLSQIEAQKNLSADFYKQALIGKQNLGREFKNHLVGYYSFDNVKPKDSVLVNHVKPEYNGKLSSGTHLSDKGYKGKALSINGDESAKLGDSRYNFERNEPFTISMWINSPKLSDKGYTILANCATTYHGFRGYEFLMIKGKLHVRITSAWPSNALEVVTIDSIASKKWAHVAFSYDGSSLAQGINIFVNGKKVKTSTNYNDLYRTIKTHTLEADKKALKELELIEKKRPLTLMEVQLKRQLGFRANYSKTHYLTFGGRFDQGVPPFFDGLIDEVKIYNKDLSEVEITSVYSEKTIAEVLQQNKLNALEIKRTYLDYLDENWRTGKQNLIALRQEENKLILPLREIKVMKDRKNIRETYILNRGNYDAPTKKVNAGSINAVMPFDEKLPKNRMGLAQWITSPKNPIAARVVVNRYWQMIFGTGLVASSSDFGNQGQLPTHPELLDWLAIKFVDSGWDVKALLKLIVSSATYQQSAKITPESLAKDPQNMLLSRSPRYRYIYEMIRDNALAAADLINPGIGGKSFKPYQTVGLWEEKTDSPVNNYYQEDDAPEIYRRSMYIYIKRTSPHPAFSTFDAPERFTCQVKRQNTNTPLQALTARNDPQFVEAARVLAQNTLEKYPEKDIEKGISLAFRKVLSRFPNEKELKILTGIYSNEKRKFIAAPAKANKLIATGKYPLNKKLNPIELASMTIVSQTILNLDETICRE